MSEPVIRRARPGEEAAIHEAHMRSIREVCVKDHGEEEIKGWGNRPLGDRWKKSILDDHVWVIEQSQKLYGVAFLRLSTQGNKVTCFLDSLYLTPEVLGKGLGAQFMELILKEAKKSGANLIELNSTITAHGFYMRFGFKDTGPKKLREIGGSLVTNFPMALDLT